MRILASFGISSGSSSLTSPNTAATDFDAGLGRIGGSFYKQTSFSIFSLFKLFIIFRISKYTYSGGAVESYLNAGFCWKSFFHHSK